MTIAGSDSGGGAGIQADLKTFASLRVFGTSAIACVTAQNPRKVAGIFPVSPEIVALQIKTVCDGFRVSAAKTGMLYSAAIVRAVAGAVKLRGIKTLVVDPVMVATSGARLLKNDAVRALCSELLPLASVVTPNIAEAETLCGHPIVSIEDMKMAAHEIGEKFGCACVVKGGHIRFQVSGRRSQVPGFDVVDVLYARGRMATFSSPRIVGIKTHGTGCAFSAALTAFLARGEKLHDAVKRAKLFVLSRLKRGAV